MAERKLKLHMFNLVDGTTLLGDKYIEYDDRVYIKNPLIIQKLAGAYDETDMQIVLMRYDNFNSEDSITIKMTSVITFYPVSGELIKYYTDFIAESKAFEEKIEAEAMVTPELLNETTTKTATHVKPKLDIDKLRRDTIKIVVNNDEEN